MKIKFVQDPSGCAGFAGWLPYSQVNLEVGKIYEGYEVSGIDGVEVKGTYVEADGSTYTGLIYFNEAFYEIVEE